jgi:hypothetical protein
VTDARRLAELARLTGLLREHRLAELRKAGRQRAAAQAELDRLAQDSCLGTGDTAVPCGIVGRHETWRGRRRAELNIRLAALTATWLECSAATAEAVGRDAVARRLAETGSRNRGAAGRRPGPS